MSCGNHHDTDCKSVLEQLYTYIDGEIDAEFHHLIQVHLTECAPCLSEFEIEQVVKALVKRSCSDGSCSDEIRGRIIAGVKSSQTGSRLGDSMPTGSMPTGSMPTGSMLGGSTSTGLF